MYYVLILLKVLQNGDVYKRQHYNRFPDQNFFLINPNIDGLSEYYLMNKEVKIAKIVFDNSLQKIDSILEIYNAEYAPLECFNKDKLDSERMTAWFKGRGIPSRCV